MTKKVITPASGSAQTVYYETNDGNTVVKFSAGGRTVTSHSKTDVFGRKEFDELQLGTGFVSRRFSYMPGAISDTHKASEKVKSSATTQLVSQIALSDGRTISYEYDEEERITKVTDSFEGTTVYTYDALGQLLTETVNNEVVNTEVVNSMEYDNYGNIVKKNGKTYTYGNTAWKDLLTSYNGQAIEYDAQGNPISYLGHTLTWEKGRQLKSFDSNTYTYNANGIRTSKTVGGVKHTYTLDGTKILRETWGSNTLVPLYDNEDGVCGILYNNVPYYFIKNLQGDVIAIVDKDAKTAARYSYDAWGVPEIKLDSSNCRIATVNPFRYRGYYYDEEIELYYLQSRYYDASVGRFINADEGLWIISNNLNIIKNIFSYCENSPTTKFDFEGKESDYIYDQHTFWGAQMIVGHPGSQVSKVGCGYVATYNAMHRYSSKIMFSSVLNGVFWSGGINIVYNAFFNVGASVFSIIAYLRTKFFSVKHMIGFSKNIWRIISDFSDAIIVSYSHKNGGGHYIAGIKQKYKFKFYNSGLSYHDENLDNQYISIDNFYWVLEKAQKTPLSIVGVRFKKGWW